MEEMIEEGEDVNEAYAVERQATESTSTWKDEVRERAAAIKAKTPETKVQTIDETGDDSGFFSIVGDTLKGTVAGPVEATKEALEAVASATAWGAEKVGVDTDGPLWDTLQDMGTNEAIQPEGTAGHVAKGLTQFLTGFIPAFKLAKAAKLGTVAAGFAAGGAADAIVFDPNDPNLTRFLDDNGWMAEPVTEFLATDPNDHEAVNRLRNVLEGGILGVVGEGAVRGLMGAFKAYRATGAAGRAKANPDNVEIPDEVVSDLGDDVQTEFISEDVAKDTTSVPDSVDMNVEAPLNTEPEGTLTKIKVSKTFKTELEKHPDGTTLLNIDVKGGSAVELHDFGHDFGLDNNVANPIQAMGSEGGRTRIRLDSKMVAEFVDYVEMGVAEGIKLSAGARAALKHLTDNAGMEALPNKPKAVETDIVPTNKLDEKDINNMAEQAIHGAGRVADNLDDSARSFNQEHINSSEDVRKLLDITDAGAPELIDEAKRGVQSLADTKRNAQELADLTGAPLKKISELYDSAKGLDYKMLHARQTLLSSADELVKIAKIASASGTPQDMIRVRRQMAIHAALQAEVKGTQTEIARALNAMKVGADANDAFDTLSLLGGEGVSRKSLKRIIELADTPNKLNKFTRKGVWAKSRDAVLEYFINSILSGPATQVVNITSNGIFALTNNAERYLAAGFNLASRKKGGVTFGEARAQSFGMLQGLKDAMFITDEGFKAIAKAGKEAVSTMPKRVVDEATGEVKIVSEGWDQAKETLKGSQDEFGNALRTAATEEPIVDNAIKFEHHVENSAISAKSLGASGVLGQGIDMMGSLIRTPGRALLTGDEFFKSIGYRMELNAQAYRKSTAKGFTGDDLIADIARQVENPTDELHLAAVDGARYQTYTRELGETGAKLQQLVASAPILRFVVPFIRTPTNILKAVAERTPGANLLLDTVRDDIMAGGARRQLAVSRMSMGTSLYALAGSMAGGENPRIIGGGPSDPASRTGWLADGKQPYSIRIGDEWHAFNRMDPFGSFFGLAADMVAISGNVSEKEMDELAQDALGSFMKNVGSKTYLKGIMMWVKAADDPDRFGQQLLNQYAAAFVPNLLAQTNRATSDTTARSAFTMLESMQAKIPGWSNDLPPRLDLFGEPVIYQGGLGPDIMSPIYTSAMRDDPVREEIARLEVPIAWMAKSLDGIELDSKQYHDLQKFSATGLHKALEKQMNSFAYKNRATENEGEFEGSKQMLIRNVIAKHNARGRKLFLQANPEFARQVRGRLIKKAAVQGNPNAIRELRSFEDLILK
jgi:hypothetical protein